MNILADLTKDKIFNCRRIFINVRNSFVLILQQSLDTFCGAIKLANTRGSDQSSSGVHSVHIGGGSGRLYLSLIILL